MTAIEVPARPQDRVRRRESTKRDWGKVTLAGYYLIFLVFLYGPMIVMAILSFQGYYGGITFPFVGPFSHNWWRTLDASTVATTPTHAADIQTAAAHSLELSVVAGLLVAFLAFTLSMAFRRRWRFKTDSAVFYLIMLALMTPGFLLAVGTQLFWSYLGFSPTIWKTALGANVVWGIPFGFLVMLAVWNRYDQRIEESARDLGADQRRTFLEVTLPLVWTGIFGCFLFGFTLAWNDYDRSVLFQTSATDSLPLEIGGITFTSSIRPDLYALGTATTILTLFVIGALLLVASLRLKRRGAPVHRVEEEFGVTSGVAPEGVPLDGSAEG